MPRSDGQLSGMLRIVTRVPVSSVSTRDHATIASSRARPLPRAGSGRWGSPPPEVGDDDVHGPWLREGRQVDRHPSRTEVAVGVLDAVADRLTDGEHDLLGGQLGPSHRHQPVVDGVAQDAQQVRLGVHGDVEVVRHGSVPPGCLVVADDRCGTWVSSRRAGRPYPSCSREGDSQPDRAPRVLTEGRSGVRVRDAGSRSWNPNEGATVSEQERPEQQQTPPGTTDAMTPLPDHGEDSYRGSGRLDRQGGRDHRRRQRHRPRRGHRLRPRGRRRADQLPDEDDDAKRDRRPRRGGGPPGRARARRPRRPGALPGVIDRAVSRSSAASTSWSTTPRSR